jgi:exopolysaccharide biosynthesis predicted pyruvyltransferase EpsI
MKSLCPVGEIQGRVSLLKIIEKVRPFAKTETPSSPSFTRGQPIRRSFEIQQNLGEALQTGDGWGHPLYQSFTLRFDGKALCQGHAETFCRRLKLPRAAIQVNNLDCEPDLLENLRGRQVYFDSLYGNHGDRLICLAAGQLFNQAGIDRAKTAEESDVILLNGGGAMAEGWFGLQKLAHYNHIFPRTPLVVWPSSYHFPSLDLAESFRTRESPAWLWARERQSLKALEEAKLPDLVSLRLDHDLALRLDKNELFSGTRIATGGALIVERDDWEGPTGRKRPFTFSSLGAIPQKWRAAARQLLFSRRRQRDDRSVFAQKGLHFLAQRHPETTHRNTQVGDISLSETCSFQEFLERIAECGAILTTRLHVALLGHLLNKPTYLVEGTYHKFRGVFDYSLRGGSVQLVRWAKETQELIL